jgi:hypothetical protein
MRPGSAHDIVAAERAVEGRETRQILLVRRCRAAGHVDVSAIDDADRGTTSVRAFAGAGNLIAGLFQVADRRDDHHAAARRQIAADAPFAGKVDGLRLRRGACEQENLNYNAGAHVSPSRQNVIAAQAKLCAAAQVKSIFESRSASTGA